MNKVLQDLIGKCCFVYIDDIVVYSRDVQRHFQDLKKAFAALESAGLTLNLKKCKLVRKSLTFLEHVISEEGIKTEDSKVGAVRNFPTPKNVKEVEQFLGLAGWYHRFIPHFSERAAPLHALKKKGVSWNWSEECQHSLEDLKDALQKAPVLMPPDASKPFKVQTDVSDIGLGAVLTQDSERGEHVIAYASRLLQGAEKSYAVSEKECLAVVWAVEKCRQYLEGRPFVVLTDHGTLTWVFNHPHPTSRLTRWAIRLQGFDFTVMYRKGRCNVVPDSLSRAIAEGKPLGCIAVCKAKDVNGNLPINWEELGRSQKEPGYMVGIDLMGPFPRTTKLNKYLLVTVDYCSKWVEVFPLRSAKTPLITYILIKQIFTRWGTNLTERVNRTLKIMIASYVKDNHRNWDQWIHEFRFAINSSWQESTNYTPAEIALGRKLKGPLELLQYRSPDPDQSAYEVTERQQSLLERVKGSVAKAQSRQQRYYNRKRRQETFQEGELVWVRAHSFGSRAGDAFTAKLAPKWQGPAKILQQLNNRIRGVGSVGEDTCELGVFALSMLFQTLVEELLGSTSQHDAPTDSRYGKAGYSLLPSSNGPHVFLRQKPFLSSGKGRRAPLPVACFDRSIAQLVERRTRQAELDFTVHRLHRLAVPTDQERGRPALTAARPSKGLDPTNATEPPQQDSGETSRMTENCSPHPGGRLVASGPQGCLAVCGKLWNVYHHQPKQRTISSPSTNTNHQARKEESTEGAACRQCWV
ncbi:Retrovirus-related Pol polyprotein from transposon 17.6 [Labeo rohita]|uniref:ribonuclease H n=1 Tax=Labeo rohita TaxID=84645 RepID=A0ABQ8LBC9_LABRO|nr:Retrovirus-related Pol polyprotein from transposon 17.6 [Labeo rohita]